MNGGTGLVTAENILLKSIENSLKIDISGIFSGSSVCQPAPPAALRRGQFVANSGADVQFYWFSSMGGVYSLMKQKSILLGISRIYVAIVPLYTNNLLIKVGT